mgnify:FL=1
MAAAPNSDLAVGAGADTLVFNTGATLKNTSVNASGGNDYLSFSAAVFSTSTVAGGAADDTFVFQTSLAGAAISLGAGNDSVSFVTQVSSATIWGAADSGNTQTIVFSSVGDAATFTGGFGAGFISLGAGNDSITFSDAGVTGTTITGTDDSDTIKLLGQNTAVFGSAIGTSAQISFGAGADMATFSGAVSAATIYGGTGADTLDFNGSIGGGTVDAGAGADSISFASTLNGSSIYGGAGTGTDTFAGAITVGTSGVSFFGGGGADTFNFSTITGSASGTAYFWNDASGTDSIVFGSIVSGIGSGSGNAAGVAFGITSAAGLNISFVSGQTTASFGGGVSNLFDVHNQLVTYGVNASNYVSMTFVGGGVVQLQGLSATEAVDITNTFGLAGATTANFGTVASIPTFS